VLFLASFAKAQPNVRNSVTFSVGSAFAGPRGNGQFDTTAGLGVTYRYRWFHYLDIEAGIMTALHPTPTLRGATFTIDPTDNFIWVPFGLRGVLPLRNGAMELSAAQEESTRITPPGTFRSLSDGSHRTPGVDTLSPEARRRLAEAAIIGWARLLASS
jgi:hypothetical protein